MSVAFAFFVNYVRDYQAGSGSSVLEAAEIEDVWFRKEDYSIEIWLYNYGKIDTKISSVYVNSLLVDSTSTVIQIGKHGELIVYLPTPWAPNTSYHIRIISERGSAFEGEYVSPSGP
jgi:hypothetical protein